MKTKILLVVLITWMFSQAQALTFQVTVLSDEIDNNPGDGVCETSLGLGFCSLRAAIIEANALGGVHTIELDSFVYELTILGDDDDALMGDLDVISADLFIIGNGPETVIDANTNNRIFEVMNGRSLNLSNLTLTAGRAGTSANHSGGAINVSGFGTQLFTNYVTIINNSANLGAGLMASNNTEIHITDTNFLDNYIEDLGFANLHGPAIYCIECEIIIMSSTFKGNDLGTKAINLAGGFLFMTNTTMTDNEGGGIRTKNAGAVIRFSTFVSSSAQNISIFSFEDPQVVDIGSSILFTPADSFIDNCQTGDKPVSSGYNIVSDSSCEFSEIGDSEMTDAMLSNLANNGGFTNTFRPMIDSPAIDLVPIASCLTALNNVLLIDQRGEVRPNGSFCDAGAVEVNPDIIFINGFD